MGVEVVFAISLQRNQCSISVCCKFALCLCMCPMSVFELSSTFMLLYVCSYVYMFYAFIYVLYRCLYRLLYMFYMFLYTCVYYNFLLDPVLPNKNLHQD